MNFIRKAVKPAELLIIAGKTKRVTVKYPFEKPILSPEFRGSIEINHEKCIGCGACVNACPPNALEFVESSDKRTLRYNIGRCIFCWRCIDVCPVNAITGTRNFELATNDPLDLYSYIVHSKTKCTSCGKTGETVKMRKYIMQRSPVTENYINNCPDCRREKFINALSVRKVGFVAK